MYILDLKIDVFFKLEAVKCGIFISLDNFQRHTWGLSNTGNDRHIPQSYQAITFNKVSIRETFNKV